MWTVVNFQIGNEKMKRVIWKLLSGKNIVPGKDIYEKADNERLIWKPIHFYLCFSWRVRLKMANRVSIALSSGLWPWRTKIIHNIKWCWCMSSAKSTINLNFKPKLKTWLWPLSENGTNRISVAVTQDFKTYVSCTDSENTWSIVGCVRIKIKSESGVCHLVWSYKKEDM